MIARKGVPCITPETLKVIKSAVNAAEGAGRSIGGGGGGGLGAAGAGAVAGGVVVAALAGEWGVPVTGGAAGPGAGDDGFTAG